jgi:hypothetical protein
MKVKVLDSYTRVMFTAELNDALAHVLTMREQIKPHIKKSTLVAYNEGNAGDHMEYLVEYDGYFVAWEHFAAACNKAN